MRRQHALAIGVDNEIAEANGLLASDDNPGESSDNGVLGVTTFSAEDACESD